MVRSAVKPSTLLAATWRLLVMYGAKGLEDLRVVSIASTA